MTAALDLLKSEFSTLSGIAEAAGAKSFQVVQPVSAPAFSRSGRVTVELRQQVAKETIDTLDAVSLARDMDRYELVEEVLGKWAAERRHEATLIANVMRGNGDGPESGGGRV